MHCIFLLMACANDIRNMDHMVVYDTGNCSRSVACGASISVMNEEIRIGAQLTCNVPSFDLRTSQLRGIVCEGVVLTSVSNEKTEGFVYRTAANLSGPYTFQTKC